MKPKDLSKGLILGAGLIYLVGYTGIASAQIHDPTGFVDDKLNGLDDDMQQKNLNAFLMTIRKWESSIDDSAWKMLVGGGKFNSFDDHPRIAVWMPKLQAYSTAAGAFQIVAVSKTPKGYTKMNTWDRLKKKLSLPDFSPASQTAAAIELIKERGAYYDVLNGRFAQAVEKCRAEWASMPGAPYPGQPTAPFEKYVAAFKSFGGTVNV